MSGAIPARHLVWDWNGTLFHDMDAVLGATNAAFAELGMDGLDPLTLDRYRELYRVPVTAFYEALLGRAPTPGEWELMDGTFQRHYARESVRCGLTAGAVELLDGWLAAGRSQSLLSMYGHEELVPLVKGFGIADRFVRVQGRTGPSGGGKADHLVRHLAALAGDVDPARTVVIGDAADDGHAARAAGARAVLYTGGSHSRASLARTGFPVADSLADAVALAAAGN
ncbi:HAD family hydrolase [Streptomyces sp. SPB074]|uniref:HAD family hydrolase n=1 Tax=Streptomyces sp. (strain SPB074) TaxID=465543 RepID=UPI00017F1644|nr:HAD hydrolase-like protein [Streptomyces sp. SPB074]EDY45826.1 phosphatase [Streptomyces sp. SPB074]